jgi:hypothetical protein
MNKEDFERVLRDIRSIQSECNLLHVHCIELEKLVMMHMLNETGELGIEQGVQVQMIVKLVGQTCYSLGKPCLHMNTDVCYQCQVLSGNQNQEVLFKPGIKKSGQ